MESRKNRVVKEVGEVDSPWPEFFNQRDSFESQTLGRRACGPTTFAMAINLCNKRKGILKSITPLEVLWKASKATVLPDSSLQYKLLVTGPEGQNGFVPIGDKLDNSIMDDIDHDRRQGLTAVFVGSLSSVRDYDPVFTLTNGWDHRGSKRVLDSYNLRAEQIGDHQKEDSQTKLKTIISHIQEQNLIIASVNHKENSSHLVLITEHKEESGDWLLIHDPKEHSPQWVSAQEWYDESFRGYGTVIYNEQKEK